MTSLEIMRPSSLFLPAVFDPILFFVALRILGKDPWVLGTNDKIQLTYTVIDDPSQEDQVMLAQLMQWALETDPKKEIRMAFAREAWDCRAFGIQAVSLG